jgi:predicted nucleotidyltransferase
MNKGLTAFPELDRILSEYSRKIQEILGNNFVGMYLQGSLAIGDFDMTSDVDFIVVIKEEPTAEQVKTLQEAHTQMYGQNNRWVKRMEYSFFPLKKFREQSSPYNNGAHNDSEERKIWYFDNGHSTIEKSDHCNTLVTRWTVREKGVAVIGPDAKTLINPIKLNDLKKEIKDSLIGWGRELLVDPEPYRNRFYQAYLVLNFARMLQDIYEGRITSKLEGANWAKKNLDHKWRDLIDFCWEQRKDPNISIRQPAAEGMYEQSIEFVKYCIEQAEQIHIGNKL